MQFYLGICWNNIKLSVILCWSHSRKNNEENANLKRIENDYDIYRYKAALASNIRGALTILKEENINSNVINQIQDSIERYSNYVKDLNFKIETSHREEIQCIADEIIVKPYKKWMAKEKNKIKIQFRWRRKENLESNQTDSWICNKNQTERFGWILFKELKARTKKSRNLKLLRFL
jgi:hypothetical protein